DDFCFRRQLGQLAIRGTERIIVGSHKNAALETEHGVGRSLARRAAEKAAPGASRGKIRRAQQSRFTRNEVQNLFAVPDVIPAGKDLDSSRQQFFGEPWSDAET